MKVGEVWRHKVSNGRAKIDRLWIGTREQEYVDIELIDVDGCVGDNDFNFKIGMIITMTCTNLIECYKKDYNEGTS